MILVQDVPTRPSVHQERQKKKTRVSECLLSFCSDWRSKNQIERCKECYTCAVRKRRSGEIHSFHSTSASHCLGYWGGCWTFGYRYLRPKCSKDVRSWRQWCTQKQLWVVTCISGGQFGCHVDWLSSACKRWPSNLARPEEGWPHSVVLDRCALGELRLPHHRHAPWHFRWAYLYRQLPCED